MAQTAQAQASGPQRPKGILKNSGSDQQTSPKGRVSPEPGPSSVGNGEPAAETNGHPGMPSREFSDREITQMNTDFNAGNAHRRNGSNPRGSISRRQSGNINGVDGSPDESGMRLKWDEANLYLNEGQMGGRMKITEPKTPFAGGYDPTEDDEEIKNIDAHAVAVDELDMNKPAKPRSGPRESEIPGLDLGEPEMDPIERRESEGERRVVVDSDHSDVDGGHHGEENEDNMSREELEKHKKFERMRKKHYEMKNIKNLLGHPEDLDALDDEE